jgi:4-amino-4-deoxy-L-arabinose transferase-like glycosyltransferase
VFHLQENKMILSLMILVNILTVIYFLGTERGLWWDEVVYLSLGRSILKGSYGILPNRDIFRPIVFPLLVALSFMFDGEVLIRIIVEIFSILGVLSTYYLGKKLYDTKIGLLSAFILSSSPLYAFFSQKILTETVFITLSSLALTTFYIGIEKNKKFIYISAFLTGISILTKYFGFFLLIFYLIYILLRKKISMIKEKEFYLILIILFLTLTPWFLINNLYYGNPIGGMFENADIYLPLHANEPFYFFFVNSWQIFGLTFIFIPIGLYYSIKKFDNNNLLVLIACVLPFIVFSLTQHKEIRYMAAFLPAFSCVSAYGIQNIPKKLKVYTLVLLGFLIMINFYLGSKSVAQEKIEFNALKEGSIFIKNLTSPDEYIMSESYPYLSYYADRASIRPPKEKEDFYKLFDKHNITFVFVDVMELGNPNYILSELNTTEFEKVKSFSEWNKERVIIYKKL